MAITVPVVLLQLNISFGASLNASRARLRRRVNENPSDLLLSHGCKVYSRIFADFFGQTHHCKKNPQSPTHLLRWEIFLGTLLIVWTTMHVSLPEIGGYTFQKFLITKIVTDFLNRFISRKRSFPHFSHELPYHTFTLEKQLLFLLTKMSEMCNHLSPREIIIPADLQ